MMKFDDNQFLHENHNADCRALLGEDGETANMCCASHPFVAVRSNIQSCQPNMEQAMSTTKYGTSPQWDHVKRQYSQWQQRVEARKILRRSADKGCARFEM